MRYFPEENRVVDISYLQGFLHGLSTLTTGENRQAFYEAYLIKKQGTIIESLRSHFEIDHVELSEIDEDAIRIAVFNWFFQQEFSPKEADKRPGNFTFAVREFFEIISKVITYTRIYYAVSYFTDITVEEVYVFESRDSILFLQFAYDS